MGLLARLFTGKTTNAPNADISDYSALREVMTLQVLPAFEPLRSSLQELHTSIEHKRGEVGVKTWQAMASELGQIQGVLGKFQEQIPTFVNIKVKESSQVTAEGLRQLQAAVHVILKETEHTKGYRILAVEEKALILDTIKVAQTRMAKMMEHWQTFNGNY